MPRWSGANRASRKGADDALRCEHRRHDSAKADQPEGSQRGDSRFLWAVAIEPVHGSDESSCRADSQTPIVRTRTGRFEPGPGRLRSARRASFALWPNLSDRDAGKTEHRSYQLDEHLFQDQRVRIYRDALSSSRERPGIDTDRLSNSG